MIKSTPHTHDQATPLPPACSDSPPRPALELRGITKTYGYVTALSGAHMHAYAGEVLAVVGDNGAGKSTLVKIVSGVARPDEGTILIGGEVKSFHTSAAAREAGVATVFQDLGLVEVLDVATNMFLGAFPRRYRWIVDRKGMEQEARAFLDELGVSVRSVRTPIGMLSGGQRQIVAIARTMRASGSVVLLDEPTAALGVRETAQAVDLIHTLRARGSAVVCVSHDLNFVFDIADRVQVMRLGKVAGVRDVRLVDKETIVGLITGSLTGDHEEESA